MKRHLVGVVVGALWLPSVAVADVAVPPSKLIAKPKSYVGRDIIVRAIACVDPGKSGPGFLCVAHVGAKTLRIEALLLGAKTKLAIAERLIGACKGESALDRDECKVDITITPTGAATPDVSDDGSTVILTNEIEMYAPGKVR